MIGFRLRRLGMVMEPEPGNPQEVEGVLNPTAVRGPDGSWSYFRGWLRRGTSFTCEDGSSVLSAAIQPPGWKTFW
jgi:hypothetical protein